MAQCQWTLQPNHFIREARPCYRPGTYPVNGKMYCFDHGKKARAMIKEARNGYHARLWPCLRPVGEMVARGLSNQEIADTLGLSPKTVENYIHCLMEHYQIDPGNPRGSHRRVLLAMAVAGNHETAGVSGE